MRDLARLAIAAFGRQGGGSGVIGVDVQRIRRSLELRGEAAGRDLPDPDSVPQDRLRGLEWHLRRALRRRPFWIYPTLPPLYSLPPILRVLPSAPLLVAAAGPPVV